MEFAVDQPIAAGCEQVEAAFVDRDFYAALADLPSIDAPEILEWEEDDNVTRVTMRYRFTGELAPAARAVLDPAKLTWVQESTVDHRSGRTEFRMHPQHYGGRLSCSGSYVFDAVPDGTTIQRVRGTVKVRWPLVGGAVERAIVGGMREHIEAEAAIVERWVRGDAV